MRAPRWPRAAGILDRLDVLLSEDQFRKVAGFLVTDVSLPDGTSESRPGGTVTFVRVPVAELPGSIVHMTYAITTRHSLFGARNATNLRIRVNNRNDYGTFIDYPAPIGAWIPHPSEDVAVLPFIATEPVDIEAMYLRDLLTDAERHRYKPGDDVFLVGLYSHHGGVHVIEPILRFGHLSLVPRQPVAMAQFRGDEEHPRRDAFLIEAQTWPGQSGSPVFAYWDDDRPGPLSMRMLGIVHGYSLEQVVKGQTFQWVNAGIGIVVPAHRILEALEMEDVVADRKRRGDEILRNEPDTVIGASGFTEADEGDVEFARFTALTRGLLSVPKDELDEKRRQPEA